MKGIKRTKRAIKVCLILATIFWTITIIFWKTIGLPDNMTIVYFTWLPTFTLALINIIIPVCLAGDVYDYNKCEKMFEASKVIGIKDKEEIKEVLELGDDEEENVGKLKDEYYITYNAFLTLIHDIDAEVEETNKQVKKGMRLTKDFKQLGREIGIVGEDVERYGIISLALFNTTEEGVKKVYHLVKCCHKLQKAYRSYLHSYADNYTRRTRTQTTSSAYDYQSTKTEGETESFLGSLLASSDNENKNESRLVRDSKERYSDDELINIYGLEQEQIDELRENDLDPWNFNEEELTPEDFYYEDDFYQDKIKRGEEKEEP